MALINENTRQQLEETADWMNAYENICKAINQDILGFETTNKSAYSMDLARYLEKLYFETMTKNNFLK